MKWNIKYWVAFDIQTLPINVAVLLIQNGCTFMILYILYKEEFLCPIGQIYIRGTQKRNPFVSLIINRKLLS